MNNSQPFDPFQVSREKLELLEYLLAEEGIKQGELSQIKPRGEVHEIPLSFAQQRLWFLHQLDADRAAYNISAAYHLRGPLDLAALQQAINEIIRRHESFRTTFRSQDGQAFQVVASELFVELLVTDLSKAPGQEKEAEVCRLTAESAEYPFELAQGPLLRASLLRLDSEQHALLLCMHHIVSDGWSMNLLFQEMAVLYEAFSTGKPSPLAELPIQYADFAIWQRDWLQGEVLKGQVDYWRRQLGDFTNEPTFPTDRPRPSIQTHRGARHSMVIAKPLTSQLYVLSRTENVTLFMLLLAAFKVLLHRHSGQEHIIVGSPIANRNQTETEALIGFFVNTLVLRTELSGNPSFRELLSRVRETAVGAYAHQDLPFEMLVEELQPARNLSHSPLFQIMFVLQNAPAANFRLADLAVAPLPTVSRVAKFDLTLFVIESEEELKVSINYNSDLFEAATMARLGDHYGTLLQSIVEDPAQPIASLGLMTEAERHQLLVEWNATDAKYPKAAGLHQLFELQAERTPGAVAVVFDNTRWSYRELNQRANQLAHYLRLLGTKPEELVGVCLDRSAEMIVALLGILKAGAAYVPLDSNYPQERLSFMLKDSRARLLITHRPKLNSLPQQQCQTVCLDTDWKAISRESSENPVSVSEGANAAYVIYTSGSTGTPKGVITSHQAVTRLVIHTDYVTLKPVDVVAQASNASFDAVTWEIWGALLNGARLVGISTAVLLSPKAFAAEIREKKISAMFLTTALFNQMAREFPSAFKTVEHLMFGGEAAETGCVRAVSQRGPPRRLLNVYGPTETTTFASWHRVDQVADDATTIPIGRPIKNCQMYVLDAHLQPVPVGVEGGLYVAGEGLARGYLNHPDLTAERFIPNPFGWPSGSRLYRTGDLARYRGDGHIEFVGRVDGQVKLRGFRIEPGEIEEALRQHSGVQEAIVLAREDPPGEKRLVAYAIPLRESRPTVQELRKFLQTKLPDYMVPSAFVFLDSFPITPNGKVNRKALPIPTPALGHPPTGKSIPQPADKLELQLLNIWKSVLRIPSIEVTDNFFELGGHSLMAVRLVAAVEKVTGKTIPLATLFQAPTIEQMAQLLRKEGSPTPWSLLLPVQLIGPRPPLFFLHGTLELAKYMDHDQPFYIGQLQGKDGKALPSTIELMAAEYIEEIRRVQPVGPYFLCGYSVGGLIAFEIAQQLRQSGAKIAFLALVDPTNPSLSKRTTRHRKASPPPFRRIRSYLRRQVRNLARSEFRQWPASLARGIKWRVQRRAGRIKRTIYRYCLSRKIRVPVAWREFYWVADNRLVAREYKPSVYPESALLFVSRDRHADTLCAWKILVAGGLQIEWVASDHLQILREPQVQAVAEQLNRHLRQAPGPCPIN